MVAEGPAAPGVVRGGGTGDAYAESDGSRDGDSAEMPSTPPYSSEVCPHDLGGGTCTPLQLWGLTDRRPPGIGGGVVQNDSNIMLRPRAAEPCPRSSGQAHGQEACPQMRLTGKRPLCRRFESPTRGPTRCLLNSRYGVCCELCVFTSSSSTPLNESTQDSTGALTCDVTRGGSRDSPHTYISRSR